MRSFRKVFGQARVTQPRVINVDQNAVYPGAIANLKQDNLLPNSCQYRASKYLNNQLSKIIASSSDVLNPV